MPYFDVFQMTQDAMLGGRVAAAAAQEAEAGATLDPADPEEWAKAHQWDMAAAPGWGDAWASAVAGGNPEPGRDDSVITDAMILSQVQAVIAG